MNKLSLKGLKPFSGYNLNQLEKDALQSGIIPDMIKYSVKAFPSDESSRAAWVKVLQRKDTVDIQNGGVCEKHFLNSDFLDDPFKRTGQTRVNRRLKKGAVPSIFDNYPTYAKLNKPMKERSCLLYTSPSPRDLSTSRMPSSA